MAGEKHVILETTKDLVYSAETQFMVCKACGACSGTGRNQDQNKMYNPAATHGSLACERCKGRGHEQEFLSFNELLKALLPYMVEAFEKKIPELISRLPYEIVREIMES